MSDPFKVPAAGVAQAPKWEEMYKRQIEQAMLGDHYLNSLGQAQVYPGQIRRTSVEDAYNMTDEHERMRMLGMRLRVPQGAELPFEHISTALSGETVFVFVLSGGKPAILEDGADLFPSDTLITQLRLIQK